MQAATDSVRPVSRTFPRQSLDRILREAQPFTDSGHYLYPADATGSHTKGFFAIEPVTRVNTFVDAIADDMERWSGTQAGASETGSSKGPSRADRRRWP
ncbi:MAG: hypothetical protein E6K19_09385 [Methanobacteriota archaeon]|nr:MAG: hypothetical protein E6K19_09385 [Euryarchaeota archaeon]